MIAEADALTKRDTVVRQLLLKIWLAAHHGRFTRFVLQFSF
jgi:hypothetical protein